MTGQPIRIGYCLSLSGPLASNGKTARLAHQIWEGDVNRRGGLLSRPVEMICLDDQTNPALVPDIYKRLLDEEKVELVIGGYGDNSVAPAMPLIMERRRYLVGLMALAVNAQLAYPNYFVMIPTGPHPNEALTDGFFELAAAQMPKPKSMAILAADAPFAKNPVAGAIAHASKHGFQIVSDARYPLTTTDFAPLIGDLRTINPDILFLCSYLNDSAGLLRAINTVGLEPKMLGGSMIGPQNGSIKAELGPLLNGVVNYEYWLPVPKMMFPGVAEMIAEYQSRAGATGADPLGYYVAPQAYAQMQVVEQAIAATGSLEDEALAAFTRSHTFKTILGDVTFGDGGGWSEPRVLQAQYRDIKGSGPTQFKGAGTQAVVWPPSLASGSLVYPYAEAKLPARTAARARAEPSPNPLVTAQGGPMSNTVATLLMRNLHEVFGENDAKRRRAAIDEIFANDCVFYEPNGVHRGRDEIDRVAGAIRAIHPDHRYQPQAPEELGDAGRVRWVEGRPGEGPAVAGTDFIIVRDDRIAAVYLFFDELP